MKDNCKQKAYDYLYDAIITNVIQPGQPIIEQEISSTLGTSRTPVREALKQLESEGLVRHIPGRGTFVSEVTTQDVEEIFTLRSMLEILALQSAWKKISDKELEEASQHLVSLDSNCSADEFYKSDRMIHDLIVRNGGNRRLDSFLKNINAQIERIRIISSLTPQRLGKSKEEHLEIISALKERNLEKTEELLRAHINNVKESAIEVCRNMRFDW
ncbi:MAG TPA: GntR family transcriptional regulator [Clostridia bacterium]|nr:GntR family transcriptional regulator [Clostridia bacterium]